MGGTADLGLAYLCIEEASPSTRACLEPAIDELQRQLFAQAALVVDHRVEHLSPGTKISVGEGARQRRLDDHRNLAHRVGRIGPGRRQRIAEIGRRRGTALARPVGKILLDQCSEQHGIEVADHRDDRVFRAIPAIVERLDGFAGRGLQAFLGADGQALGKALAGEQRLHRGLRHALAHAAALALFGQHDRHLGVHIGVGQHGRPDHAGQQLHAFFQLGGINIGQVQLVDRMRRAGLGIGVAAEGCAEPLPGRDRLGDAEILALAEQQVFEEVGISQLVVFLVERTRINPDADGDLARRDAVFAHAIAKAVLELAEQPFGIAGHVAALVDPRDFAFGLQRCRSRRVLCDHWLDAHHCEGEEQRETPCGARKIGHAGHIVAREVKDQ